MAYLRRGLITNRGEIPSVHTRQQYDAKRHNVAVSIKPRRDFVSNDEQPPVGSIQKVKSVLRMAPTEHEYHFVELECGHRQLSRSTYQAFCKICKH